MEVRHHMKPQYEIILLCQQWKQQFIIQKQYQTSHVMSDNINYILYVRIDSYTRISDTVDNRKGESGDGFSGWKQEEREKLLKRKIVNKCCRAERWKMKEIKSTGRKRTKRR